MTKNLERLMSKAGQAVRREASTKVASLSRIPVKAGKVELAFSKRKGEGHGKAEQRKGA